ncbi:MAG: PrsW family glutamic-type intramembrane protease [Candidatus Heimdallarchaeota archaeon]
MWRQSFRGISSWRTEDVDPIKVFMGISFLALIAWLGLLILAPVVPSLSSIAFYCGPFLFAPIWTAFALWVFHKNSRGFFENDQLRVIAFPCVVAASTVAFSALILNSNATLLSVVLVEIVANLGFEMSEKFLLILVVGFVAPFMEELIKLLPILALSRATMERPVPLTATKQSSKAPLLISVRFPVLLGIVVGSAFVVLETYFYMFFVSTNVSESDLTEYRYFQLFLRTVGPLHVLTAAISGLGVGLALLASRRSEIATIQWHRAFAAFLIAWGLHAGWNTIAVLTEPSSDEMSFALQDNLLFVGMAILVFFLLLGLILSIGLQRVDICHRCQVQKITEICFVCRETPLLPMPRRTLAFWRKSYVKCPSCKQKLNQLGACTSCNAQVSLICPNCWFMVGPGEKTCRRCGDNLQSLPEAVPREHLTRLDAIARGSVAIFAAWMLPMALGVLTLAAYLEEFDALFVLAAPFVLAGFAAFIGLVLEENSSTRASGRYIIALVFYSLLLSFGLFLLAVTLFLLLIGLYIGANDYVSLLIGLVLLFALAFFLTWVLVRHFTSLDLVFPLKPSQGSKDGLKWASSSNSKLAPQNILVGSYAFALATGLYMVLLQVWLIAVGEFSALPVLFLSNLELGFFVALIMLLFLGGSEVDPFMSLMLLWACWGISGFICGAKYGRTARFAVILGAVGPFISLGIFFVVLVVLLSFTAGLFILAVMPSFIFIILLVIGFTALTGLFFAFPAIFTTMIGERYFEEHRARVRYGRLYRPMYPTPSMMTVQRQPPPMRRQSHEKWQQ